jgi:hypothetical protein
VTVRPFGWAALIGLALVGSQAAQAADPCHFTLRPITPIAPASGDNQKLADAVAAQLRQSALLHDYGVDVAASSGTVELTGTVADQHQREEVVRLAQGVPGVSRVIDHTTVATKGVSRVQAVVPPPPAGERLPAPGAEKGRLPAPLPGAEAPAPAPAPGAVVPGPVPGYGGAGAPEPAPVGNTPIAPYTMVNPPRMPPYAWPTYAPYNNFSRVGYPAAMPYNAWPFIGPIYPFPKIPLGWRSVKLQWDDGYWWYGRVGCKYDWWKIRYW